MTTPNEDTARMITLDELSDRTGISVRTIQRRRRVLDDGREYYDILGTPVARICLGGRNNVRVPFADVAEAIRRASMTGEAS